MPINYDKIDLKEYYVDDPPAPEEALKKLRAYDEYLDIKWDKREKYQQWAILRFSSICVTEGQYFVGHFPRLEITGEDIRKILKRLLLGDLQFIGADEYNRKLEEKEDHDKEKYDRDLYNAIHDATAEGYREILDHFRYEVLERKKGTFRPSKPPFVTHIKGGYDAENPSPYDKMKTEMAQKKLAIINPEIKIVQSVENNINYN